MRRALATALLAVLAAAGSARADGPLLRDWYVGLQAAGGTRDRTDVFGRPGLPAVPVADRGRGGGLLLGRRFGGRFLLGAQLVAVRHDLEGADGRLMDVEALVTGTVLLRERAVLQPFLRGGFGAGGMVLEREGPRETYASFGPAALAGGGVQVRLSGRVSLEAEAAAVFTNHVKVEADFADGRADGDWSVRVSSAGWRAGAGVTFWF